MNKTAVITGASGGIGSALCESFAKEGYDIIMQCFRNKEEAQRLCEKIKESCNVEVSLYCADFSKSQYIKAFADFVNEKGGADILVNNAGVSHVGLFQLTDDETAREIFAVNTESAMLLTKELISSMIRKQNGRIINISSMWGVTGASCEVHYSASKAALIGFTKALAKEVGPSGITVNCIAPGMIDTKMNAHLSEEDVRQIIDETPVGRIGTGEDVANLAVFLADEKASFITGQIISVDGGYSV